MIVENEDGQVEGLDRPYTLRLLRGLRLSAARQALCALALCGCSGYLAYEAQGAVEGLLWGLVAVNGWLHSVNLGWFLKLNACVERMEERRC